MARNCYKFISTLGPLSLSFYNVVISKFLLIAYSITGIIYANEFVRPNSPFDYATQSALTVENTHAVSGVKVAWANYEALRRDFVILRNYSNDQIDKWLLKNFSRIGADQPLLNNIRNSPIPIDESAPKAVAYRPANWRRSAALEALDDDGNIVGMVDIKGFGHGAQSEFVYNDGTRSEIPSSNSAYKQVEEAKKLQGKIDALNKLKVRGHSNGLMSLGEAIAEMIREQAISKIFKHSASGLEAVESYAILKLPFNILKEDGQEEPASLYLRQANEGRNSGLFTPSFAYRDRSGKFQYTSSGSAIDFGGATFEEIEIARLWGESILQQPGKWDPQKTKPWEYAHDTAWAYAKQGNRQIIETHRQEMLSEIDNWIAKHPEIFSSNGDNSEYLNWVEKHKDLPYSEKKLAFNKFQKTNLLLLGLKRPFSEMTGNMLKKQSLL
ncbi:MAG: hypothetical protein A2504_09275 [Bdellovibrionales bacterium RIFOXYD12_FULL_39_22]|nr:MAG: hypothetical protein A2385_17275 [Bdellovibrionales bacterium RIFOXYB1_FULL_39_21]OFZ41068.1 MAG: hypothetical protein A2485_00200 [Bdellovibrionales bacterium RIFOXYC12_FULL_39_17]OFZ50281.1 MAG: hypothetical protein A2404_07515 [Bdellovibrionales bacterium RIFOXYC1_FULL_39_130]OFZ71047.1 MAG: hypothetical protein A2451_16065 [Bdellovibrionales bacterium RIFOXYC2_FULL_39_8]OFZ75082.1 MAG: hypothetical protein A2560_16210 [Bdellovibrionales bacterium RIFOXYD1_FULL_39_84]OFZ92276.1 MAG: